MFLSSSTMKANWALKADGYRPVIPALLSLDSDGTCAELAQGIASSGYRIKHGQSVALSAPFKSVNDLGSVLSYLHLLRYESLTGQVRAGWFNGVTMSDRTDLLVWTRQRQQFSVMRGHADLKPQAVSFDIHEGRLKYPLASASDSHRTLVCQPSVDMTSFCESLCKSVRPFMMVVDLTQFGLTDDVKELLDHLDLYFKECPVLLLTTTGDLQVEYTVRNLGRQYHFWRQSPRDNTPTSSGSRTPCNIDFVEAPDNKLNMRLLVAMSATKELADSLKKFTYEREQIVPILFGVLASIRNLVVPFSFYENYLNTRRKGGLFPIMPLQDKLERARMISLPTGEAENLQAKAVRAITDVITLVKDGTTGKQQAVEHWLENFIKHKDKAVIFTQSELEADALRSWLSVRFVEDIKTEHLVICSTGVRNVYRYLRTVFDQVLILGKLNYANRWANFVGKNTTTLGLPCETLYIPKMGSKLIGCLDGSEPDDTCKSDWWDLSESPYLPITDSEAEITPTVWGKCSGQYQDKTQVQIDLPGDDDWIKHLMDFDDPTENGSSINPQNQPGIVTIKTDADTILHYTQNQIVNVLKNTDGGKSLSRVLASDVTVGDTIVRVIEDDTHDSLFDALIDYAEGNVDEFKLYKTGVEQWQSSVDHAIHRCGTVFDFHQALVKEGASIGLDAVKNWAHNLVIGPKDANIVPLVIKIAGGANNPKEAQWIQKSQQKIRGLHVGMGRLIGQLAINAKMDFVEVQGTASHILDQQALSDIVAIEAVVQCIHSGEAAEIVSSLSLEDTLRDVEQSSNGSLIATKNAFRTAAQSPFVDIDRARSALLGLSDHFSRVYKKEIPIQDAVDYCLLHRVFYKGDSSEITKGIYKSEYFKTYNGRKVDIGKHLSVGDSGDPSRCLRIHFHWDEDDQSIVVHHVGKHLPTSSY
jgi:hypothetical protein